MQNPSFSLDQFEGPLDLLLYLVQKEEIDICALSIKELTLQVAQRALFEIDVGAEMLALAATLLLMKSQKLIPNATVEEEEVMGDRMEMIQKLIEYCRFKEAAKALSSREEIQRAFFPRNPMLIETEKSMSGIRELSLSDLTSRLQTLIEKSSQGSKTIEEDLWQVAPKLAWLRQRVQQGALLFDELFSEKLCREELIVTFLALLELMKEGNARLFEKEETIYIHV